MTAWTLDGDMLLPPEDAMYCVATIEGGAADVTRILDTLNETEDLREDNEALHDALRKSAAVITAQGERVRVLEAALGMSAGEWDGLKALAAEKGRGDIPGLFIGAGMLDEQARALAGVEPPAATEVN